MQKRETYQSQYRQHVSNRHGQPRSSGGANWFIQPGAFQIARHPNTADRGGAQRQDEQSRMQQPLTSRWSGCRGHGRLSWPGGGDKRFTGLTHKYELRAPQTLRVYSPGQDPKTQAAKNEKHRLSFFAASSARSVSINLN